MSICCLFVSVFWRRVKYIFRWTFNYESTGPVNQGFDQGEIFLTLLDQFRGSTLHRRKNG